MSMLLWRVLTVRILTKFFFVHIINCITGLRSFSTFLHLNINNLKCGINIIISLIIMLNVQGWCSARICSVRARSNDAPFEWRRENVKWRHMWNDGIYEMMPYVQMTAPWPNWKMIQIIFFVNIKECINNSNWNRSEKEVGSLLISVLHNAIFLEH